MHPNVSERIQMGPNRSDEVRTRSKTSKNVENDPKPSENIKKIRDRRANFSDAALSQNAAASASAAATV